tara:strand:+ start:284 stop:469 length:186 start_codon:yes stop_codon:yes gene_type:complete
MAKLLKLGLVRTRSSIARIVCAIQTEKKSVFIKKDLQRKQGLTNFIILPAEKGFVFHKNGA